MFYMVASRRAATSIDVAARAGVSQSTVSRALRNLASISPGTREKVYRAARELDYVPRETGRSLAPRATHRIAVVTEALTNPFYAELVEPLRRELAQRGYRTVLVTDDSDDVLTADDLTDGSYDGAVITTAARRSGLAVALAARGMPHVFVNRVVDASDSRCCTFANAEGAGLIADMLADSGHERVGLLIGPERYSTGYEREAGLRAVLRQRRITLPTHRVRRVEYTAESGRAAARAMLGDPVPPTVIVCGNDLVAIGALNAARSLGLVIPQDLSIVGFDDISIASWDMFDLTTVRCDLDTLARASIDMLAAEIGGDTAPARTIVPVTLVKRGTHGVPPER